MKRFLFALISFLLIFSCTKPKPKPRPIAYFRIDFPKHQYVMFNADSCPFKFEMPKYAKIVPDKDNPQNKCWFDIVFPQFKASISVTYYPIDTNLSELIDDSYELAYKHSIRADDIVEKTIVNDTNKVYVTIFDIKGNAASPFQFHITDSTKNFFRASLYFKAQPNRDSLQPAIEFIEKDIMHLINTFRWK